MDGPRTTEFWISLGLSIFGLLMMVGGTIAAALMTDPALGTTLITIGASLAGVSGGAYGISRGLAKAGQNQGAAAADSIARAGVALAPFLLAHAPQAAVNLSSAPPPAPGTLAQPPK